jgi:hypothetical protein
VISRLAIIDVLQSTLGHRYATDATCSNCQRIGAIADQVLTLIEPMQERLKAAEDVCVMYAWSPTRAIEGGDREKATYELWRRWFDLPGTSAMPDDHPDLTDDLIDELARKRDETRARTMQVIADRFPGLKGRL